jgi:hypothetical protein
MSRILALFVRSRPHAAAPTKGSVISSLIRCTVDADLAGDLEDTLPGAQLSLDTFQAIPECSHVESIRHLSWRSRAPDPGCASYGRVNFVDTSEIAQRFRLSNAHVRRLLRFAYLAPDIVEAIIEGRQARSLTVKLLLRGIPLDWADQRAAFGFH